MKWYALFGLLTVLAFVVAGAVTYGYLSTVATFGATASDFEVLGVLGLIVAIAFYYDEEKR